MCSTTRHGKHFPSWVICLLLAIDVVRCSKEKNFVIFSDSLSSLQAIGGFNIDSDLVQNFLKDYTILAKKWQEYCSVLDPKSCWNPWKRKSRCSCKVSTLSVHHSDEASCHQRVMRLISEEWQEIWDCCAGNKLHAMVPTVCVYKRKTSLSFHDSVLINRLRIGHTHLTHSYLLSGDDQPECDVYQCPLSVKHIMIECVDLHDVRNKHFVVSSMKDLFWKCCITEHRWFYQGDLFFISNFNVCVLMFVTSFLF